VKTRDLRQQFAARTLAATAALATGLSPLVHGAHADGVNVQSHSPVANTTYVMTEDAMLEAFPWDPSSRRLLFGASYNWVNDPFVEMNTARTQRLGTLVESINTLDLLAGYSLSKSASINVNLPLHLTHLGAGNYNAGLGDVRLFAKFRLTDDGAPVAFSLVPELRLPTGSQALFLSDGSFSPGITLAAERDFETFRVSANIGYRYSSEASFRDLNYTQRVPVALGAYVPISDRWGANAELAGALTLPRNSFQNPGEFYAGARYLANRDMVLTGGVSIGTLSGERSNDFRAIVGLRYSPVPSSEPSVPMPVIQSASKVRVEEPRVVFTQKQILISEEVKFKHNQAALTPAGKRLLNEVAEAMLRNAAHFDNILIEGHTNELGSRKYNERLSKARARTVKAYLVTQGVPASKLRTAGFGEERPKVLKGFPKYVQLELNRRVEFKVRQSSQAGTAAAAKSKPQPQASGG
jgi:outer membrane protein OmpA-like peptidoglycan-associated protein